MKHSWSAIGHAMQHRHAWQCMMLHLIQAMIHQQPQRELRVLLRGGAPGILLCCIISKLSPGPRPAAGSVPQSHVSSQFLEDQLHVLRPLASGHYLSPRAVNLALQYLTRALELKGTYEQLRPQIEPFSAR